MDGEKIPGIGVETEAHAPEDALEHVPLNVHPELEEAGVQKTSGVLEDLNALLQNLQAGNTGTESPEPIIPAHQFEEAHEEEPVKKNIFKRIFDKIFRRSQ